jgi:hypothetical protein
MQRLVYLETTWYSYWCSVEKYNYLARTWVYEQMTMKTRKSNRELKTINMFSKPSTLWKLTQTSNNAHRWTNKTTGFQKHHLWTWTNNIRNLHQARKQKTTHSVQWLLWSKQLAAGQHVMPIDHHYVWPSNRQTNGCLDATRTSTYILFVYANIQRTNQDGHESATTHVSPQ